MRALSLLVLLLIFAPAVEAAEPKSVLDLFNRLPDPPASAQDAAKWFDQNGKLIHPGLLALKADIEANKQASEIMAQSAGDAVSMAPTIQGMENVGIDVARMQRDPAYAEEMQQKIQKMSPQEQMAFTKKLMEPQNQAAQKDVQAMAQETPAVQAAVEAAKNWPQQQLARATANAAISRELDQVAQRAAQNPFSVQRPKMDYWGEPLC
jgi:hypothetical protein